MNEMVIDLRTLLAVSVLQHQLARPWQDDWLRFHIRAPLGCEVEVAH